MLVFTDRDIELARRMHELGIEHTPEPGDYYFHHAYVGSEGSAWPTPLQPCTYLLVDVAEFVDRAGGKDRFARDFTWLPTWESGCAWCVAMRLPIKHVYYTVKEGVMFYGEKERELLYGEMLRILEIDRAASDRDAATARS